MVAIAFWIQITSETFIGKETKWTSSGMLLVAYKHNYFINLVLFWTKPREWQKKEDLL